MKTLGHGLLAMACAFWLYRAVPFFTSAMAESFARYGDFLGLFPSLLIAIIGLGFTMPAVLILLDYFKIDFRGWMKNQG